jgi:hypothetical protein
VANVADSSAAWFAQVISEVTGMVDWTIFLAVATVILLALAIDALLVVVTVVVGSATSWDTESTLADFFILIALRRILQSALSSALVIDAPNVFWAEVADFSATRPADSFVVAGVIGGAVIVVFTDRSALVINTVFACIADGVDFFTTEFAEATFADLVVVTVILIKTFIHAYVVKTPLAFFTDVVSVTAAGNAESTFAYFIVYAVR